MDNLLKPFYQTYSKSIFFFKKVFNYFLLVPIFMISSWHFGNKIFDQGKNSVQLGLLLTYFLYLAVTLISCFAFYYLQKNRYLFRLERRYKRLKLITRSFNNNNRGYHGIKVLAGKQGLFFVVRFKDPRCN